VLYVNTYRKEHVAMMLLALDTAVRSREDGRLQSVYRTRSKSIPSLHHLAIVGSSMDST
jgi:hypothetical protein